MDQSSGNFFAQKEAVSKELLDLMINALQKGALSAEESEKASRFIVREFEKANDIYYLKAAVEDLCVQWPCFSPALISFEEKQAEEQDQAKIEETQAKIEELQNSPR